MREKIYYIRRLTTSKIVLNASWLGINNVVQKIAGLILALAVARVLGRHEFGVYTLGLAFGNIAFQASQMGLNTYLKREVSKSRESTGVFAGSILVYTIATLTIGLVATIFIVKVVGYNTHTARVIVLMMLWRSLDVIYGLCVMVFHGYERMVYQTAIGVTASLARVATSIWLLLLGAQLEFIIVVFLIIAAVKVITGLWMVHRLTESKLTIARSWKFWKKAFTESVPMGLSAVFSSLSNRLDTFLLSLWYSEDIIGLYNAAYSIFANTDIIPMSLWGAVFPRLASQFSSSKARVRKLFLYTAIALTGVGLAVGLLLFLAAKPIILVLYREDFVGSIGAMRILAVGVPFFFLSNMTKGSLNAIGRQLKNLYLTGIAVSFNIAANLLLIPRFSYRGAAISTVLTYALGALVAVSIIMRILQDRDSVQAQDGITIAAKFKSGSE